MSGKIYQKAQQDRAQDTYQKILDRLEGLPNDSTEWKEELKSAIDELITHEKELSAKVQETEKRDPWDFSAEKARPIFAGDDLVKLCPIQLSDEEVYRGIRLRYSLTYRAAYATAEELKEKLFTDEALAPQVFYCMIRKAKTNEPLGYLGIKDTSADLWEIAIELDEQYTAHGYGPHSIRLYLNELYRVTGRTEILAMVEVDNAPSQRCFERLGAKLVGLRDGFILKTDEEKTRFEERNLDLIDANMVALAERLGVEPRKLLSHVLDYRLTCPLEG